MSEPPNVRDAIEAFHRGAGAPEDLLAIVMAAYDLAAYREVDAPLADDMARAVVFELEDRVRKLPEYRKLVEEEGMRMEPTRRSWWWFW